MKTRAFFLILTAALLCMQGSAQTLLPRPEAATFDMDHKVAVNSRKTVFKNIPKNQRTSLNECLAGLPAANGGRRITLQLTAPVAPADECDRQAYALNADKNGVRITASDVQGSSMVRRPYANLPTASDRCPTQTSPIGQGSTTADSCSTVPDTSGPKSSS